jgi:hypothetical protein
VWALFLPAGTTHIFQPLDQFPFAILKNGLRTARQDDAMRNLLNGLKTKTTNDRTVQHAINVLSSCLSESSLKASFEKCGLLPWSGALIVKLAQQNIGKLKVPTVNAVAHKVAQTLRSLMTPPQPTKTVEVEAEQEVAYTSVQLVSMSATRATRIQDEADEQANKKRNKMKQTLKRKRALFDGELEEDGLPVAGDAFWSQHCTYCAAVRRTNSKIGSTCDACGVVYLCAMCNGNKRACDLVEEHRRVCEKSTLQKNAENEVDDEDSSDGE